MTITQAAAYAAPAPAGDSARTSPPVAIVTKLANKKRGRILPTNRLVLTPRAAARRGK